MKRSTLLLVLAAFLAGFGTAYLILRGGQTGSTLLNQGSQSVKPERIETPVVVEPPRDRQLVSIEPPSVGTPPPALSAPPTRPPRSDDANEYKNHIDSSLGRTFPSAAKLAVDDFFNPKHVQLTADQLHELQRLLEVANAHVRQLDEAIEAQTEAHSRDLVDGGLGRPVANGEKVHAESPEHDTLALIHKGTESFAVSYAKHSVPEIAASMDEREDYVKSTCTSLQQFIGGH